MYLKADFSDGTKRQTQSNQGSEDSLDRRIAILKSRYGFEEEQAQKGANRLSTKQLAEGRAPASQQRARKVEVSQDWNTQSSLHRSTPSLQFSHASSASYGYTSNVPKFRCTALGSSKVGQANIAMSYAGPPTESEIHRNADRWRENRNYLPPSTET